MSQYNQIITAFCTALGAQRAAPYIDEEDLPFRSVFDLGEEASKQRYSKYTATASLIVASKINAQNSEGDDLDTELATIQSLAFDFADLSADIDQITYTGRQYDYSENGSSVVTLVVTFDIEYSFDLANP